MGYWDKRQPIFLLDIQLFLYLDCPFITSKILRSAAERFHISRTYEDNKYIVNIKTNIYNI